MDIIVDILVKIFLYLPTRQDILNGLLTCKHFYRVSEKFKFWLELYRRYEDPTFDPTKLEGYKPHTVTFRDAFRCNFHSVNIRWANSVIFDLTIKDNFYREEIIGMFLDTYYGVVVLDRGGNESVRFEENYGKYYPSFDSLEKPRTEYCIEVNRNSSGAVSLIPKTKWIEVEHLHPKICYDLDKDNLYPVYQQFIAMLQEYFGFDQIKFEYDYELTITLSNASIKTDTISDGLIKDGSIFLIIETLNAYLYDSDKYTYSIFYVNTRRNKWTRTKSDIPIEKYKSIINPT